MTIEELDAYHNLIQSIVVKEKQINLLRQSISSIKSPSLEGTPHGSGISDRTANAAIEITDLEERLSFQRKAAKKSESDIRAFINAIDDDITRLVYKFRVLYGYSWQDVADTLGGYNTKGSVRNRYVFYAKKAGIMGETDEKNVGYTN